VVRIRLDTGEYTPALPFCQTGARRAPGALRRTRKRKAWYNAVFVSESGSGACGVSSADRQFLNVDVERRGYGRRYTSLPVDELGRDGFAIDFTGAYTRPDQIDIRVGDIVRWHEGGRQIQAEAVAVVREALSLRVTLEGARPLPPEAFHP